MKARLIWGILLLGGCVLLSSCGDDPAPIAGVSFETEQEEIVESNGALTSVHPEIQTGGVGQDVKVRLILDKPLSENAVISYTVTGTASKKNSADNLSDFYLDGGNAKDTGYIA